MRSTAEICDCKRLMVNYIGLDGGQGVLRLGTWDGSVIWSNGGGWEHVSVAPFKKRITPSWDDMCRVKEIFFKDTEDVIEIHPRKEEYVNMVENCLHLWRKTDGMDLPPSWMVGVKKGQTVREVLEMANKALEGENNGEN